MRPALLALLIVLSPAAGRAADVLVPPGSSWLYLDDGSDQGTAWQAPAFVDGGWASGAAPLGYGGDEHTTIVSFGPDPDDKHVTTYFRQHFNVADPTVYSEGLLRLRRDDGAIVYLNGTEIYRTALPSGTVTFETFADTTANGAEEYNFISRPFDPALLVVGDNVLAVEVHQRSATSSDLSFDAELRAGDLPFVTRGPYVQLATETSMVVRWRTHVDTPGRVRYGHAPGNLTQFVDSTVVDNLHEVTLSGFTAGQTVFYSVGTDSDVLVGDDADHVFRTAPPAGSTAPLRIWVLGDSGEADSNAEAVRDAYLGHPGALDTDVWLMLGDNAYDEGNNAQYQAAVFDRYPTLLRRIPLWPTRGNHEDSLNVYTSNFSLPTAAQAGGVASGTESYYSFDHGNVHFLCLDSEGSSKLVGGVMYNWADADLAATDADWVIAYWHHPPYTKGSHDSDTESDLVDMRNNFLPLLEDHGVDLVLCGHSHSFERSFLLDGHYGSSGSFAAGVHLKDAGDGDPAGDGAYHKASQGRQGAVYAVAGSGSKLSSGPLDHPAMVYAEMILGSLVLDVDGDTLTGRFLTDAGAIDDTFEIVRHESWQDLGQGLAGALGVPQLAGDGPLVADTPVGLTLSGGLPGGSAGLVIGLSQLGAPFKGGVLVPFPDLLFLGLPLDGTGGLTLASTWPAGIPPGFESVYQAWMADAAGPVGFSASNGLLGTAQ